MEDVCSGEMGLLAEEGLEGTTPLPRRLGRPVASQGSGTPWGVYKKHVASVSVHIGTNVRVFVFPLKFFFFQTEAQKTEMVPKGQSPFVL